MALSPLSRRAGVLSLTAAVLIVLSQVLRLGVVRLLGPDWVTTPAYTVTYSIALLGMAVLLLALTAIYTRESAALGRLGLIGYLTAFLGTMMVAGDWWFEAFAIPTGSLIVIALVAGFLGLVAALIPAYRAARMNILGAIATE